MQQLSMEDIREQIHSAKRRIAEAIDDKTFRDDMNAGLMDYFTSIYALVDDAIVAGLDDNECEWDEYAEGVWTRFDLEDIINLLANLMRSPRWD